jgi:KDO2-lipid IV(A) lauroyltransferase
LNFLVYILFVFLEKTVPLLPLGFWHFWAGIYANLFYYLIPIRKKTALSNLKLAFPEKESPEINKIIKRCYRNVFIVIFELFFMRNLNETKLHQIIKMENPELIEKCLQKGNGIVIVSAHFGNWELMGYGCALYTHQQFNIIVKEQSNHRLDKRLNRIRESAGNKIIEMKIALREVLRLLGENKIVVMLGDQSAPKEGSVKVDFFVKDVPTFEGAAKFAIKTQSAMIFGYPLRQKDNTYKVCLKEIDMGKYKEYSEENIKKLTQEHTKLLEEAIRKNPDHWLWFHRRFKHVK